MDNMALWFAFARERDKHSELFSVSSHLRTGWIVPIASIQLRYAHSALDLFQQDVAVAGEIAI
jgi:hypothetical protein